MRVYSIHVYIERERGPALSAFPHGECTLPLRICRSTFTTLPGVKVSSKIMVLSLPYPQLLGGW